LGCSQGPSPAPYLQVASDKLISCLGPKSRLISELCLEVGKSKL
jgi:hypothetical protein